MTTDRELMQQALDALEYVIQSVGGNAPESFDVWFQKTQVPAEALRARLAQPEPEPVAWWHDMGDVVDLNVSGRGTPLYFAPPQREFIGLTDEEIREFEIWLDNDEEEHGWNPPENIVKYLEAKLREKNHG